MNNEDKGWVYFIVLHSIILPILSFFIFKLIEIWFISQKSNFSIWYWGSYIVLTIIFYTFISYSNKKPILKKEQTRRPKIDYKSIQAVKKADVVKRNLSYEDEDEDNYESHCWYCKYSINSNYNQKCDKCDYYICRNCLACFCKDNKPQE